MATMPQAVARPQAPPRPERPRGPYLDRAVVGILLVAAGIGWLLDALGVSVPWRLFPAAALVLVGLVLLVSLGVGSGRSGLVTLGTVLLLVALAVGVDVTRFAGPVGDRVVEPIGGQWPDATHVGAGTVTVDLARYPLPPAGHLDVRVGAGRVVLVLPESSPRVEAAVVAGTVVVDGVRVGDGLDVHWSPPRPADGASVVVEVGLGEVEVRHE